MSAPDAGSSTRHVLAAAPPSAGRVALAVTRARLRERADAVRFVVADLLAWQPDEGFDVWHDRAVFHFLTDPADRQAYVDAAVRAVRPGGAVVLSTFGPEGPDQCSGLPTARYDAASLAEVFVDAFEVESSGTEVHHTPWGAAQQCTRVTLRRVRV